MLIEKSERDIMNNTEKQARWWMYAAWTSPFVALAIIIGEELLGFGSWRTNTAIVISVTFVATSVLWWWWAISKIVKMMSVSERIEQNFKNLHTEIKEIKKDVGNRQRRESSND